MTQLLTAEQMHDIEQAAIRSGIVTGSALMERAGTGVVREVFARWPAFAKRAHRAVVLCGPGNNGGDGFVVARLLYDAGWEVDVFLFGAPARLPRDARTHFKRWAERGKTELLHPFNIFRRPRPDLIVDAVFGIGLTRPLPEQVAQVLNVTACDTWQKRHAIPTVAVDCPSGLNLDTGQVLLSDAQKVGATQRRFGADLTVTFHCPKPGHYLGQGPDLCGSLVVADIGLRGDAQDRAKVGRGPDVERLRLVEPHLADGSPPAQAWPGSCLSKSQGQGHKFDHGNVVVFAGGVGRGGAGRLAARAALRAGAGLVTLVCPPAAVQENACHLNAVMLAGLRDGAPLEKVADDRVTAFCIGPGHGVSDRTRGLLKQLLERNGKDGRQKPVVVVDADALVSFAQAPDTLFAMLHERSILTPHEGEFARLFPDLALAQAGARSKVDRVRAAADRAGCVVLLKGRDTVIAQPGGGASVHAAAYGRSVPWLATAGAGDVLAGMIAGLAASPAAASLFEMAEIATWLHTECAAEFGPGLIAEDLPEQLPKVLKKLGL